jgi:hypothetical protein
LNPIGGYGLIMNQLVMRVVFLTDIINLIDASLCGLGVFVRSVCLSRHLQALKLAALFIKLSIGALDLCLVKLTRSADTWGLFSPARKVGVRREVMGAVKGRV